MAGLPDDIVSLEEEVEYIQVLVHGDSGSGKTPFGASAAKGLVLATEAGTVSAARRGSKAKLWKCPTWRDFLKAKEWLEDQGAGKGIPFSWVTIDSATNLQQLLLRHILETEYKAAPSKRSLDIPQIQDHQQWQNEFKRIMTEMVALPVNLCATALPMAVEVLDEEGLSEEWIIPQFDGKKGGIAWTICGLFSAGGRVKLVKMKDGTVKQRIYWQKSGAHWGRDRYEALGASTLNLTLDGLATKVKAARSA